MSSTKLPRTLSLIETLGFGLTGLLLWLGVAPGAHAELGLQAMWVWIPGSLLGIVINVQVRQLGQQLPDVAGGTPNYLTHLLPEKRWLTSYAAIGYFLSWVAVIPVNAIILTNLIETYLPSLGIAVPEIALKMGFVLMAFVVAFSGSRALSILHLAFLLPAVGLLLLFCTQGSIWLMVSSPHHEIITSEFSIQGWAKWYLNGTYAFYACETASVFVADSKQPSRTLTSLLIAAGLIPVVYVAGSWLLLCSPIDVTESTDTFLTLLTAARPYWGATAPLLITFLVVSSCLLSMATAVSITPRILYQLAQDKHISPVFGQVSPQGVFEPGLWLTLLLSLVFLSWGDLDEIVMVTGVGWLVAFIVLHWGIGSQPKDSSISPPWLALIMAVCETAILCIGGWAWGIHNFAIGLLLPWGIVLGNYLVSSILPRWLSSLTWQGPVWQRNSRNFDNLIPVQIATLVGFISVTSIISWYASAAVARIDTELPIDFLVVLVLVMSFVGVAIACWTIFPKMVAVDDARKSAEALSEELESTLQTLQHTQVQMIQQEKLSSLGALVAGVAHEINNPVSFIHGNLFHAQNYTQDLLSLVSLYQQHYPEPVAEIDTVVEEIDLDFLQEDLPKVLGSMNVGTERICAIVSSLRNFSRKDEAELKSVDIHDGLDSTLALLQHRLKATALRPEIRVVKHYGSLPQVECYPSQLNQVFMNIFSNAVDAMEMCEQAEAEDNAAASDKAGNNPYKVTIRTRQVKAKSVEIAIADSGPGISDTVKARIFEPFFTTKPIGKGTGIGMSISYQIVTQKHQGQLSCESIVGQGANFIVRIPICQTETTVQSVSNG
ncbi:MAG: ATP-binding protein [Cyanobacteria bacterium P01_D01_bin.156]